MDKLWSFIKQITPSPPKKEDVEITRFLSANGYKEWEIRVVMRCYERDPEKPKQAIGFSNKSQ